MLHTSVTISYIIRKYWPTSTERALVENQQTLLYKCVGPLMNSLTVLNHPLQIHENYEDYRNWPTRPHPEDQSMLNENLNDFHRYRDSLVKINSNSVGESFYNALMKFFDNGQWLISQGYTEPKFFRRACEGLKIVKSYIDELKIDYFTLEIISYGEVVDLNEF